MPFSYEIHIKGHPSKSDLKVNLNFRRFKYQELQLREEFKLLELEILRLMSLQRLEGFLKVLPIEK